jgi:hypothetical protein
MMETESGVDVVCMSCSVEEQVRHRALYVLLPVVLLPTFYCAFALCAIVIMHVGECH